MKKIFLLGLMLLMFLGASTVWADGRRDYHGYNDFMITLDTVAQVQGIILRDRVIRNGGYPVIVDRPCPNPRYYPYGRERGYYQREYYGHGRRFQYEDRQHPRSYHNPRYGR